MARRSTRPGLVEEVGVAKNLNILVLEDEPADVILINHELRKAHLGFQTRRVETRDDFLRALREEPPDLILSDGALPEFTGFSALAMARDLCPDIPFIFVTGSIGEEKAIEMLRSGATDYVLKNRLANLVPAVQRALREAEERTKRKAAETALRQSEERFRMVVEGVKDYALFLLDTAGRVVSWNAGAEWINGYRANEVLGQHYSVLYPREKVQAGDTDAALLAAAAEGRCEEEGWHLRKGGNRFWANVVITALRDEWGKLRGFAHVTRDISERHRVEEALRQSEARKAAVMTTALDAIVSLDHEGVVQEWNPAAEKLFGYTRGEAVGRKLDELIIPASLREIYREGLATYLMTGVGSLLGRPIELTATNARGLEFRIELAITRIPAEEPPFYTCFMRDISERKANEEALRKSEERYRMLLEGIQDYAIYMLDPDGRVATWNLGAERIEGWTAEEIVGQPIDRVFPPEEAREGKVRRLLRTAAAEGRCVDEGWRVRGDGTRYWVNMSLTAMRDVTGRLYGFAKIARDVTELRQAEEARRESERLYRVVCANIPKGGGALFDRDLRYLLVEGQQALENVGRTGRSPEGQTLAAIFPAATRDLLEPRYRAALAGESSLGEVEHCGRTYLVNLVPLRDEKNAIHAGLALGIDITERKAAEDQVHRLNAELEERVAERTLQLAATNKELEAFSYSVSHDLRAPLRHIHGFVEVLQAEAGPHLSTEARTHLDTIARSASHMGQLIDNLLDFSRMARTTLRRVPVDLAELVQAARLEVSQEAAGRKVEWVIGPLPRVSADPVLLRLVIVNLLSNALKYTRPSPAPRIEIGHRSEPSEEVVFVRDNGVGFDMEYAHKLFGVFQRLHRSTEFEGTGIGLANVRRIIQRHGGRTWAEGAVNQGAVFYFSLPKANHNDEHDPETDPAGG